MSGRTGEGGRPKRGEVAKAATATRRRTPVPRLPSPVPRPNPYRQLSITLSAIRPSVASSSKKSPVFWLVNTLTIDGPPG